MLMHVINKQIGVIQRLDIKLAFVQVLWRDELTALSIPPVAAHYAVLSHKRRSITCGKKRLFESWTCVHAFFIFILFFPDDHLM